MEIFSQYLRIPSISARAHHAGDVRACADWLESLLRGWGLDSSIHETEGAPVVVAKSTLQPGKKTILLYGHYDVQPVEPLDYWSSPPFEPCVRDGFVYARGATDNKGQTFSHLIGLRRLLKQGSLPVNITILLEGEEEIGSPNLGKFLRENREMLACDAVLISDTSMIEPGWPALTLGLRGVACFDVNVFGPRADLHSGMFGGPTPNPAMALCKVLGELQDAEGRITIPGFYDGVMAPSDEEIANWKELPWNEAWFESTTGIAPSGGERAYSVLERVWSRPTVEINGLTSGHQGDGSKTIIPSTASAKISFRLVSGQDPDKLAPGIIKWFQQKLSEHGVAGSALYDHGGLPFYCAPGHPILSVARNSLKKVFGKPVALTREGLSIPVTSLFAETLAAPVILAGLGLPDCQAHAPNESYPVQHLELGAEFFEEFLRALANEK
jgi:acetylornithine deacetylase/succinyl-diaminopimelate desuccinylase-like protein